MRAEAGGDREATKGEDALGCKDTYVALYVAVLRPIEYCRPAIGESYHAPWVPIYEFHDS